LLVSNGALVQPVLPKDMRWNFHALGRVDRVKLAVVIKRFTDLIAFIIAVLLAPSVSGVSIKDVCVSDHRFFPSLEPAQRPRVRAAGIVQLNFYCRGFSLPLPPETTFALAPRV
jgi:hypothetical protein